MNFLQIRDRSEKRGWRG